LADIIGLLTAFCVVSPDPAMTYVEDLGFNAEKVVANQTYTLGVQTKDMYGNNCTYSELYQPTGMCVCVYV
jgi:hypothetical protein